MSREDRVGATLPAAHVAHARREDDVDRARVTPLMQRLDGVLRELEEEAVEFGAQALYFLDGPYVSQVAWCASRAFHKAAQALAVRDALGVLAAVEGVRAGGCSGSRSGEEL